MKRKWTKWVFGPCLIVGFCFGVRPASRRAAALAWGRLASTSEASKSMENGGSKLSRQQAGATQSGFAMAGPRSTALRAATSGLNPAAQARIVANYGTLPLSFEANHGQTDPQVKFLSRGSGYTLFLTGSEAVLDLRGPTQRANGKRQVANVAQRSPLNAAALRVAPRSLFNAAAFPEVFRFPAAENDSRAADPNTGSALRGLRDEARIPEPRIPNPDRPAHEPGRCQPAGEGQWP